MNRRFSELLKRFVWLVPMPVLWIVAEQSGWLTDFENMSVDWRFRIRGPIESRAKVYYVNRDSETAKYLGQSFLPREYYAIAAEAMLEIGQARSVFFDFVLSDEYLTEANDPKFIHHDAQALRKTLLKHPDKVILAAAYSGKKHQFSTINSRLPQIHEGEFVASQSHPRGYDPKLNPIPELPQYPFWSPEFADPLYPVPGIGRVGLIDTSETLNHGAIDRYAPAYVEVDNDYISLYLANTIKRFNNFVYTGELRERSDSGFHFDESDPNYYYVVSPNNMTIAALPRKIPQTFYAAAIELILAGDHNLEAYPTENSLQLRNKTTHTVQYDIPLIHSQHIMINWYSPWFTGIESQQEQWESLLAEEKPILERLKQGTITSEEAKEFLNWNIFDIGRDPEGWVKAVEAGDLKATRGALLWGIPDDPYNPRVSIWEVFAFHQAYLTAKEMEASKAIAFIERLFSQFKDHYILVGPTDPLLQDIAPTPFDNAPTPKVAAHGNLLKTIVDRNFLTPAPGWASPVSTVSLTILVAILAILGGAQSRANKVAALFVLIAYVSFVFILFIQARWILPFVAPVGSAVSAALLGVMIQLMAEERQKARIKGMFGSYVSPELVHIMVESTEEPQLGGHNAQITAFFSDIQSFSSFSEVLGPVELVELMNEYLDAMTEILEEERGTLDKYIGDAIVGIFGAPVPIEDHAYRACLAASRIQERQIELRKRWRDDNRDWPSIVYYMRTRIGLNTGEAVVGNMGSQKRFNYTMMGDTVNLAARNESGAKSYGVYTMVSEETKKIAEAGGDGLVFRYLDRIRVKGKTLPVSVYELLGEKSNLQDEAFQCLETYEQAIAAYLKQDWARAISLFETSSNLEPFQPNAKIYVKTNPSLVMLERSRGYSMTPPGEGWDGVYTMTTK